MAEDERIDELFAETLVGNYDDDEPWAAVHALRRNGSREVFERAAEWCGGDDPLRRARGLDVLAQLGRTLGHPENNLPDESFAIVSEVVGRETDVRPLASAIFALGHLGDARGVPLILPSAAHPHADVRFAVACALGNYPNDDRGVKALLALMDDVDDDVRDWATFGLGVQGNLDSPEIREALLKRLTDPFEDARQGAMAALGKRREPRALPALLEELEQPDVSNCIIEAAYLMLGLDTEREGWEGQDYANALHEQFGVPQRESR